MIDGIVNIAWVPHCRRFTDDHRRATAQSVAPNGDSRESPGPNSEASLSRPSTGRVLAAGALALAVSTPILDSVEHPIESVASPAPAVAPALVEQQPALVSRAALRASRSAARRSAARPAAVALQAARRSLLTLRRAGQARRAAEARATAQRRAIARRAARRAGAVRPGSAVRPGANHGSAQRRGWTRIQAAMRMSPVIAYARAQLGKSYRLGADGPNAFDCSGFTKRAYALAGLRLPHSSRAQAARARRVSRGAARAGDLVVGSGHVGIYMGGGMMIDAGNSRVGVVYRRLYPGLHIERF
jgi:cell wall-associated NlpC family hydrolase